MATHTPDTRPPNKDRRLTIRLDETQYHRLETKASRLNLTVSSFARAAILDAVSTETSLRDIAAATHGDDELRALRTQVNLAATSGDTAAIKQALLAVESYLGGVRRA